MPLHDWSRLLSALFHEFKQSWSIHIKDALNAGKWPQGVSAFVEQRSGHGNRRPCLGRWRYYVEAIGVGDGLPYMPLFLTNGWHVPVPLESTYLSPWEATPKILHQVVETGVLPEPETEAG
jgi:hypothetical protein